MSVKRLIAGAVAIGVVVLLASHLQTIPATQGAGGSISTTHTVFLDETPVRAAIADTPALREHGLSGSAPLKSDEGMLFVFENDGRYSFWMKDMLFPIDMVWIASDGHVVHIEKSVSPDTYPQTITPGSLARYVLGLSAGFSDMPNSKVGSSVLKGDLPR